MASPGSTFRISALLGPASLEPGKGKERELGAIGERTRSAVSGHLESYGASRQLVGLAGQAIAIQEDFDLRLARVARRRGLVARPARPAGPAGPARQTVRSAGPAEIKAPADSSLTDEELDLLISRVYEAKETMSSEELKNFHIHQGKNQSPRHIHFIDADNPLIFDKVLGEGKETIVVLVFNPFTKEEFALCISKEISFDGKPSNEILKKRYFANLFKDTNVAKIHKIITWKTIKGNMKTAALMPRYPTDLRREITNWSKDPQTRPPLKYRVKLAKQLLKTVSAIHDKEIIHCDLRPDNFLIDGKGNIFVADFGLSRKKNENNGGSPFNRIISSPEVLNVDKHHRRQRDLDKALLALSNLANDNWALGLVLWELFPEIDDNDIFQGITFREYTAEEESRHGGTSQWNGIKPETFSPDDHWLTPPNKEIMANYSIVATVYGLLHPNPKYRLTEDEAYWLLDRSGK